MKDEMHVGYICVLKKDGSEATKVPLGESNCTFGSAMDSTVRLKMDNPFLRNVHCEIEVQNDGIAVLINKCKFHPITLNGAPLQGEVALAHADIFEIFNRKFVYINENITTEKVRGYKRKKDIFPKSTPFKTRRTMLPRFVGDQPPKTPVPSAKTKRPYSSAKKSVTKPSSAVKAAKSRRSSFNIAPISIDSIFKTPSKTPKSQKSASCKSKKEILTISNTSLLDFESVESTESIVSNNSSMRTRSAMKMMSPCLSNFSNSPIKKLRPSKCNRNLSYTVESNNSPLVGANKVDENVLTQPASAKKRSRDTELSENKNPASEKKSKKAATPKPVNKIKQRLIANEKSKSESRKSARNSKKIDKKRASDSNLTEINRKIDFTQLKDDDKSEPCVTPDQTKVILPVSIKKSHSKVRRSAKSFKNADSGSPLLFDDVVPNLTPVHGDKIDDEKLVKSAKDFVTDLTPIQAEKTRKSSLKLIHASPLVLTPLQKRQSSVKKSLSKTRKSVRYSENTKDEDSTMNLIDLYSTPVVQNDQKNAVESGSKSRKSLRKLEVNKENLANEAIDDNEVYLTPMQLENHIPPVPVSIKKSNAKSRKSARKSAEKTLSDSETTPVLSKSVISISSTPGTPIQNVSGRLMRKSALNSNLSLSFSKLKDDLEDDEDPVLIIANSSKKITTPKAKTPLKTVQVASVKKSAGKSKVLSSMTSTPKEGAVAVVAAVSSIKKGVKRQLQESVESRSNKRLKMGPQSSEFKNEFTDEDTSLSLQYSSETSADEASPDFSLLSSHSAEASSTTKTRRSRRSQLSSSNPENFITAQDSESEVQGSALESTNTSSILYESSPYEKKQLSTRSTSGNVKQSPKNELEDLEGVKQLIKTPKPQRSPSFKGLKKLVATPKQQKGPRNELEDLKGVKKLLGTPNEKERSPRNELVDFKGVKKLLGTPKVQKDPKNELEDLRGVKKLLGTPKVQKSPKNELEDLRGVKKLLGTPKEKETSPRNELVDFKGVRKMLATPKAQKAPKNELDDLRGVKKLIATPKQQKDPKNELEDLKGVKEILNTPKESNDLSNVSGMETLFEKTERLNISGIDVLQDDNEHTFDVLCGKRNFNTYRGKSLSPLKPKTDVIVSRSSLGNAVSTKDPEVAKWVIEQQTWAEKLKTVAVVEPIPAETGKKRRFKLYSDEDAVKNVESKDEEEEKQETAVRRTRRKAAVKNVDDPTSEIKKDPTSEVKKQTKTRATRAKSKKPDKEITNEVQIEQEPKLEVEVKTRVRTRAKTTEQESDKQQIDTKNSETEEITPQIPTKRGRNRSTKTETRQEQEENKTKTTKKKSNKVSVEIDASPSPKLTPRKTRSRKIANVIISSPFEIEDNDTRKRGRPKKAAAKKEPALNNNQDGAVLKEIKTNEVVVSPPKTRQRKGAAAKQMKEETENVDPTVNNKKKVHFEPENEEKEVKSGRGKRKANAKEQKTVEPVRKSARSCKK